MYISIVTINYNNLNGLKITLTSVFEQTYPNIEYIIIDGGSIDGSKEYIESCQKDLAYWVSESDKGIYDAMNKGIDQATGEYLLFLNSGDWLVDNLVIEKFVAFKPVEDLVYGDAMLIHPNKNAYYKKMPINLEGFAVFHQTVTHQSMFFKKILFNNGRYDLRYTMLADWVFYNIAVLIEKRSYRHLNLLITNYDTSGFSSDPKNKMILKKEREMFYIQYASYFVPLFINRFEITVESYQKVQKSFLVKWAIKVTKKFKLLNHNQR